MNPLLDTMVQFAESYRYLAVFVLTFLGAFALPIPTGSLMIACGFFATLGIFDIWPLAIVGLLGNLAGDHSGYWLSRKLGEKVEKLPMLGRLMHHRHFKDVAESVHRVPWVTIVFSRFMTAVAPSVNIIAGLTKYPYIKFWIFEGFGEILEIGVAVGLGWWFGRQWMEATEYVAVFIVILSVGFVASWFFWKWMSSRRNAVKSAA